jgi:hypothetical protein
MTFISDKITMTDMQSQVFLFGVRKTKYVN